MTECGHVPPGLARPRVLSRARPPRGSLYSCSRAQLRGGGRPWGIPVHPPQVQLKLQLKRLIRTSSKGIPHASPTVFICFLIKPWGMRGGFSPTTRLSREGADLVPSRGTSPRPKQGNGCLRLRPTIADSALAPTPSPATLSRSRAPYICTCTRPRALTRINPRRRALCCPRRSEFPSVVGVAPVRPHLHPARAA